MLFLVNLKKSNFFQKKCHKIALRGVIVYRGGNYYEKEKFYLRIIGTYFVF